MKTKEILGYLREHGEIHEMDIAYFPNRFPFTRAEFNDFFSVLESLIINRNQFDCTTDFEEYIVPFEYEGFEFIWRLLIGQGAACQLYRRNIPLQDENEILNFKFQSDKVIHLDDVALSHRALVIEQEKVRMDEALKSGNAIILGFVKDKHGKLS